jgi:hypothetical protein
MDSILELREWVKSLYAQNGQNPDRLWIEPYSYTYSVTGLSAVGGTSAGQLAINANADFVCTRISYTASVGTVQTLGTKPIAQVRATIIDAGSARPFFNTATALENFASNEYPNRFLPYPRWLSANTTLSIQLVGYGTAAETYGIDLTFEGVAVRQYSGGM